MYLYKLTLNKRIRHDMFDSAVVIASSEEEARTIHPNGRNRWNEEVDEDEDEEEDSWHQDFKDSDPMSSWGRPDQVTAELIGTASSGEVGDVIVSSYNAG